jgi:hypothetical protein
MPSGIPDLEIFMIGGGASGYGGQSGGGGAGYIISVAHGSISSGTSISITIGAGGKRAANSDGCFSGGDTTVTIGGTTYTASGGYNNENGFSSGGNGSSGGGGAGNAGFAGKGGSGGSNGYPGASYDGGTGMGVDAFNSAVNPTNFSAGAGGTAGINTHAGGGGAGGVIPHYSSAVAWPTAENGGGSRGGMGGLGFGAGGGSGGYQSGIHYYGGAGAPGLVYIYSSGKVSPVLGNFDMTKTPGDSPFTITQPSSSNSSGAFTYSVTAGSDIISMSENTITVLKAGSATVQASQAASGNYLAATKTATITINRATPTLVTSQTTFYRKFVSGASILFDNVISSNAGAVPRTHVSNNTAVVTIPTAATPSATIVSPGKTTIKVTQPATGDYDQVVNNDLITIVVMGQGTTYTSEIFPASFDLSGTNLSNSTFTDCTFTSTNLFGVTVDASTNFSTCTFTGIGSGRITGKTSLLPVGFTMI